jgi:hypothetical protein
METMHRGTTWPETVPFWACLSAIWQVLLDDGFRRSFASQTSLLSLSITTRSHRPDVLRERITMLAHSLAQAMFCIAYIHAL